MQRDLPTLEALLLREHIIAVPPAGLRRESAGDWLVLRTLRTKARERQRYWLGLPLLVVGAGVSLALARGRR